MKIATWKEVEIFRNSHAGLTARFQIPKNGTVELIANNGDSMIASIPYDNGFCIHEVKCAGRNSCPRPYACSE